MIKRDFKILFNYKYSNKNTRVNLFDKRNYLYKKAIKLAIFFIFKIFSVNKINVDLRWFTTFNKKRK
jgi:hypothetical protein